MLHGPKCYKHYLVIMLIMISIMFGALPWGDLTAEPMVSASLRTAPPRAKVAAPVWDLLEAQDTVEVLVYLERQADVARVSREQAVKLQALPPELPGRDSRAAVRGAVLGELLVTREETQASLWEYLQKEKEKGNVLEMESFYIVNMVYMKATAGVIGEVAARPEVKEVLPNKVRSLLGPAGRAAPASPGPLAGHGGVEWNISRIGADKVWEQLHVDGSGVVVGVIDSGVYWEHEALKDRWRGHDRDSKEVNPVFNWYDAFDRGGKEMPWDTSGHGSHVTGIILGTASPGESHIGVAPGASWIAVRAFDSLGYATDARLLAAGQYLLAPTDAGGVPRPEMAPDIINNSWGAAEMDDEGWYREMVQNWREAQILPVFAAGNSGPGEGTINIPAIYPGSLSVGAVDGSNEIAPFSSRGPGLEERPQKPELVAPGVGIRSAGNRGDYATKQGTSMAAPHVTGTAALVLSTGNVVNLEQLEQILINTATPLTGTIYPSVPNHGYGYGLVNAWEAVKLALRMVPPGITYPENDRYTSREELTVRGTLAESCDETYVNIYNQGERAVEKMSVTGGSFEGTVTLEEGENKVAVSAVISGVETSLSDPVTVTLDSTAPRVYLDSPPPGFKVSREEITLQGHVVEKNLDRLTVNGVPARLGSPGGEFLGIGGAQAFWAQVSLQEGDNELVITAVDLAGNETRKAVSGSLVGVEIYEVMPQEDLNVKAGDEVEISFKSNLTGGEACFRVLVSLAPSLSQAGLPMDEEENEPGSYRATWTVPPELSGNGLVIEVEINGGWGGKVKAHAPGKVSVVFPPPVITLLGDGVINLVVGDTYAEPGATARGQATGDLTDRVVTGGLAGGDTVSRPGIYTVTYDVTDEAGNPARQVTREVIVAPPAVAARGDLQAPEKGRIKVTGALEGARLTLYDAGGGAVAVIGGEPGEKYFENVPAGDGYYVTQALNGVESAPSDRVLVGLLGDVNLDGRVTVMDAVLVLRYIVGLDTLNPLQEALADYNRDGRVTVMDAREVARFILGC